jgi:hypothetical protein
LNYQLQDEWAVFSVRVASYRNPSAQGGINGFGYPVGTGFGCFGIIYPFDKIALVRFGKAVKILKRLGLAQTQNTPANLRAFLL